jgi:hypothetical protein
VSVTQLSVFVQNKRGRIAELLGVLAERKISVFGFSLSEVSDYGIVRLLTEDGPTAHGILENAGFTVADNPVVSVVLDDRAGSLAEVVELLAAAGVDIDYLYLSARRSAVIRVDDPTAVESLLTGAGFVVLTDQSSTGPREVD